ncbi:MAG: hypothetical protein F6J86_06680 [Symploca sp. SIO1B1]|nr:hypothetical protein [Symploca sp. SIO1B1]
MVAAVRWTMMMLFNLIYPIIISLTMFWGLKHYTPVPPWLKATTAWIFFFVAVRKGWIYPELKVAEIRHRLSFQ